MTEVELGKVTIGEVIRNNPHVFMRMDLGKIWYLGIDIMTIEDFRFSKILLTHVEKAVYRSWLDTLYRILLTCELNANKRITSVEYDDKVNEYTYADDESSGITTVYERVRFEDDEITFDSKFEIAYILGCYRVIKRWFTENDGSIDDSSSYEIYEYISLSDVKVLVINDMTPESTGTEKRYKEYSTDPCKGIYKAVTLTTSVNGVLHLEFVEDDNSEEGTSHIEYFITPDIITSIDEGVVLLPSGKSGSKEDNNPAYIIVNERYTSG